MSRFNAFMDLEPPAMLPVPANPCPPVSLSLDLPAGSNQTPGNIAADRLILLVKHLAARIGTIFVCTELPEVNPLAGQNQRKSVVSYFADHLPVLFVFGGATYAHSSASNALSALSQQSAIAESVDQIIIQLLFLNILPVNRLRSILASESVETALVEIKQLIGLKPLWNVLNFAVSLKANERFHPLFESLDVFSDTSKVTDELRELRIEYWKAVRNHGTSVWNQWSTVDSSETAGEQDTLGVKAVVGSLVEITVIGEFMESTRKDWLPFRRGLFGSPTSSPPSTGRNTPVEPRSAQKTSFSSLTQAGSSTAKQGQADTSQPETTAAPKTKLASNVFLRTPLSFCSERSTLSKVFGSVPAEKLLFPGKAAIFGGKPAQQSGGIVEPSVSTKAPFVIPSKPAAFGAGLPSFAARPIFGQAPFGDRTSMFSFNRKPSEAGTSTDTSTTTSPSATSTEMQAGPSTNSAANSATPTTPFTNLTKEVGSSTSKGAGTLPGAPIFAAPKPVDRNVFWLSGGQAAVNGSCKTAYAVPTTVPSGEAKPEKDSQPAQIEFTAPTLPFNDELPVELEAPAPIDTQSEHSQADEAMDTSLPATSRQSNEVFEFAPPAPLSFEDVFEFAAPAPLPEVNYEDGSVTTDDTASSSGTGSQDPLASSSSSSAPTLPSSAPAEVVVPTSSQSAATPLDVSCQSAVPQQFKGRRQENGNACAAREAAIRRLNVAGPPIFGVAVSIKPVAKNAAWFSEAIKISEADHGKTSTDYRTYAGFLYELLNSTKNSLMISRIVPTARTSFSNDSNEGVAEESRCFNLRLNKLIHWPGVFFSVSIDAMERWEIEVEMMKAFIEVLLEVLGLPMLVPFVEEICRNKISHLARFVRFNLINALGNVCNSSRNFSMMSKVVDLSHFAQVVNRHWKKAFVEMKNRVGAFLRQEPIDELKAVLQQLRGCSDSVTAGCQSLFAEYSQKTNVDEFKKIGWPTTSSQDGGVEIVDSPEGERTVDLVDLTEDDTVAVESAPIASSASHVRETEQSSSVSNVSTSNGVVLPLGLHDPTSEGAVLSRTYTHLPDNSSGKGMNVRQKQWYTWLRRFLNAFLAQSGFSLRAEYKPSPDKGSPAKVAIGLLEYPSMRTELSLRPAFAQQPVCVERDLFFELVREMCRRFKLLPNVAGDTSALKLIMQFEAASAVAAKCVAALVQFLLTDGAGKDEAKSVALFWEKGRLAMIEQMKAIPDVQKYFLSTTTCVGKSETPEGAVESAQFIQKYVDLLPKNQSNQPIGIGAQAQPQVIAKDSRREVDAVPAPEIAAPTSTDPDAMEIVESPPESPAVVLASDQPSQSVQLPGPSSAEPTSLEKTVEPTPPANRVEEFPFGISVPLASLQGEGVSIKLDRIVDRRRDDADDMKWMSAEYGHLMRFINRFLYETGIGPLTVTVKQVVGGQGEDIYILICMTVEALPRYTCQCTRPAKYRQFPWHGELSVMESFVSVLQSQSRLSDFVCSFREAVMHEATTNLVMDRMKSVVQMLKAERKKPITKKRWRSLIASYWMEANRIQDFEREMTELIINDDMLRKSVKLNKCASATGSKRKVSDRLPKDGDKSPRAASRSRSREAEGKRRRTSSPQRGFQNTISDNPDYVTRLPFGIASPFPFAAGSIVHRFSQIPLRNREKEDLRHGAQPVSSWLMQKSFMSRVLVKAGVDLLLEQVSDPLTGFYGFVIRLEGIPDSMFYMSCIFNFADSRSVTEDGIIHGILQLMTNRLPAIIPPAGYWAITHNEKCAEYLAVYVSGALKSVLARAQSMQGLILAGARLTAQEMASNLDVSLSEYWTNNEGALCQWLESARSDYERVSLPEPAKKNVRPSNLYSGQQHSSVAERLQSELMQKMTSGRRTRSRSRSLSRSRSGSPRSEDSYRSRRRRRDSGRSSRSSSVVSCRSENGGPEDETMSTDGDSRTGEDGQLSSSDNESNRGNVGDRELDIGGDQMFSGCSSDEVEQLLRIRTFLSTIAQSLQTRLHAFNVRHEDNSRSVCVRFASIAPLLLSGSALDEKGQSAALRSAVYKMFDALCGIGEVSFPCRDRITNNDDAATALSFVLQPLFSHLLSPEVKHLAWRLESCEEGERGPILREFGKLSRKCAITFWKEHEKDVTAATAGRMPPAPPIRVPSPVLGSAMLAVPASGSGGIRSTADMGIGFVPPPTARATDDAEMDFTNGLKKQLAPPATSIKIKTPTRLSAGSSVHPGVHVNPAFVREEPTQTVGLYEQTYGTSLAWPHELFESSENAVLSASKDRTTAVNQKSDEPGDIPIPPRTVSEVVCVEHPLKTATVPLSGAAPKSASGSIWNMFGPQGNWKEAAESSKQRSDGSGGNNKRKSRWS